ncbi:hypothetical protein [Actinoplanes subtropicus]|uniref:hypothetical protein n=1 Tax=Actinoplanes subtropicus TaxID=543632 RepID=UPI0012F7F423|nr:hypothetical protein [Actinoplanes subtropicus]
MFEGRLDHENDDNPENYSADPQNYGTTDEEVAGDLSGSSSTGTDAMSSPGIFPSQDGTLAEEPNASSSIGADSFNDHGILPPQND